MRSAKKTSIKYKLFISQISLISVAVISFFIISSSYFIIKTKDDILRNMKYSSNITASTIYNYINNMENCIYYASYNTYIQDILSQENTPAASERMKGYSYIFNNFAVIQSNYNFPLQLTLYPIDESLTLIDGLSTDKIDVIENSSWFKALKENPTQFLYFTDTHDGKDSFCIINTLYNSNNYDEIVGYIKVSTDLSIFEDVLRESSMANSESVLLNSFGNVICSSDKKTYSDKNSEILFNVSEKNTDTIKLNGKSFYAIKKNTDNARYSVVIMQNTASAFKTAYRMFLILLMVLLVIFAASFAISRLISGSVIKSLDTLIYAMKKAKFGELKPIENYNGKNAELVEAISAYNHMVTSINDLVAYNNDYLETLKKYEFNFLQMQIKPHFLYNTLDIIQYLAKENKTDDVTFLIKNLSKFYKTSLHNKSDFVTIENEIKHISYYTAIENFKHDNAIELNIDIPDDIQKLCIPKITLQPLIENSINHGILEKENPVGCISVTAEQDNDDVYIYITDNGVGISEEKADDIKSGRTESVGIMNTDKRLKLFFGNDYGLTIEGKEGEYTRVTIKIKGVSLNDKNNDC